MQIRQATLNVTFPPKIYVTQKSSLSTKEISVNLGHGLVTFVSACCCCTRNYHKGRGVYHFIVSGCREVRHKVAGSLLGSHRSKSKD